MAITDLPLFSMLRTRMHWHQERQRVLAENVSNADTPKFQPRDLEPLKFDRERSLVSALALTRTSAGHLASADGATQFNLDRHGQFEARPSGNAVSLEDEMMKVAANQMDYQAVTTLYQRSLGLLKTAMGKR